MRLPLLVLALTAFALPAAAQEANGWSVSAGAGAIYAPAYSGSDDYQLSAVPDVTVKYEDKFEASVANGVRYNLVRYEGLTAGPIARYDGGRDEDGKRFLRVAGSRSRDLQGMGDVDGAVELGGFASYEIAPAMTAEAEVRQALGGHEGLVGDLGVNYTTPVGGLSMPVYLKVGPRMKIASSDYTEAYYGIDAGQSARTGMSQYRPDGGIVSYGVGASVTVPVSERIRTTVFAGYDRLGSEAADSPLVEDRGSANQGTAGLMVGYAF